jgi:hypothetical protein
MIADPQVNKSDRRLRHRHVGNMSVLRRIVQEMSLRWPEHWTVDKPQ